MEERHVNLSVECDILKCKKMLMEVVVGLSGTSPFLYLSFLFIICIVQRDILIYTPDLQEQRFRENHFLSSSRRVRFAEGQGKAAGPLPD